MMMMKVILSCVAALGVVTCLGYRVSVGTFVSNAGRQVTVPIEIDTVAGLSYAGATITYDPQVLVVTKTEAGTLRGVTVDNPVTTQNGMVRVMGSAVAIGEGVGCASVKRRGIRG